MSVSVQEDVAQDRAGTPSFVDLRDWASKVASAPQDGNDAFLGSRTLLPLPDGPVSLGAIFLPEASGAVEAMPADEFVIVETGTLEIEQAGRRTTLKDGDSIVLPKQAAFQWKAAAETRLIFMRKTGGPEGDSTVIPVDMSAPLETSGPPLAELLVGPTPDCRTHSDYRSADGEFMCGTWDSTPYHRLPMFYRHFELMYLLEGSVSFEDGVGAQGTFSTGDIFLVEQGATCSWDSREHVKKVYAIYRPV